MRNTADVTGGEPIAVLLQSISGVKSINPLVAFYDIHGGKREVLFFYFVLDTTRDFSYIHIIFYYNWLPDVNPIVYFTLLVLYYVMIKNTLSHLAKLK
jgi:hypothetical protein